MKKLSCIFGRHHYKAGAADIKFIEEREKFWIFSITDRCVYCGKEFTDNFRIPALVGQDLVDWAETEAVKNQMKEGANAVD